MAIAQSAYGTTPAKGLPGLVANEEKCNKISRSVESAAGIEFGQPAFRGSGDHGVIAGATFAATSVGAADAGNVGAGAITAAPAVAAGAKPGAYKIVQVTGGATGAIGVHRLVVIVQEVVERRLADAQDLGHVGSRQAEVHGELRDHLQ